MPVRPISSVRGIGLAVSVSTSTPIASFFIASFWFTPNRCSSSTTRRPNRRKRTSSARRRWVPTTTSTDAVGDAADDGRGFPRGQKAREHLDPHRVGRETVGERLVVLPGEDRRRHEHGDLRAVLDRLEGGTQRDLGLAEPDVAADESVHRDRAFHVRLHLGDGAQLVGGLGVGEGLLELGLPRGVGREAVARRGEAAPVEDDELLRHGAHRLADAGAASLPVAAVQPAERGVLSPRVRRDRVDLVRGDVEPVPAPVLQEEVVALGAGHAAAHHAAVAGDAVDVVDDVAADGEVVEEALDRPGTRPGHAVRAVAPGEVALGEHRRRARSRARTPGPTTPRRRGSRPPQRLGCGQPGPRAPRSSRSTATPASSSTSAMRAALPAPSAATATTPPARVSSPIRRARGAASPNACGQPLTRIVAVAGPRPSRAARRPGPRSQRAAGRSRGADAGKPAAAERRRRVRRPPGLGERGRERRLLVEDLDGTVAHPPGLDEHDAVGVAEQVGDEAFAGSSHGRKDSRPSKTSPSAMRANCSRAKGALSGRVGRDSLRRASVMRSSRQPNTSTTSRSRTLRWSTTSKSVSRSTRSP